MSFPKNVQVRIPKTDIEYSMTDKVKHNLDTKVRPSLLQNDKDFIMVFDGQEGSGKSTLAMQFGKYIDPDLDLSRIVFSAEDFRNAVYKAKKGQCIIYDEAFTGLSSRASLSGINRALVSLMMQMRQKNLCVILVLPTVFLLDRYAILHRARVLIHVYENKGIRGFYRIYNKKLMKKLYLTGKKDYSYRIKSRFGGRFYGRFALGGPEVEAKYRKKKGKALEDSEKTPMSAAQVRYREQRDIVMFLLRKRSGLTYMELSNLLGDFDLEISSEQIGKICSKFGDAGDLRRKRSREEVKEEEVEQKEPEIEEEELESDENDDFE